MSKQMVKPAPRTIETLGRVAKMIQAIHDDMMSLDPSYSNNYFDKMVHRAKRASMLDKFGIKLGEEIGVFE